MMKYLTRTHTFYTSKQTRWERKRERETERKNENIDSIDLFSFDICNRKWRNVADEQGCDRQWRRHFIPVASSPHCCMGPWADGRSPIDWRWNRSGTGFAQREYRRWSWRQSGCQEVKYQFWYSNVYVRIYMLHLWYYNPSRDPWSMKITFFFSEFDMSKRRLKNNILRFGRITGAISSSCDSIQSIRQWQSPTASILFLLVGDDFLWFRLFHGALIWYNIYQYVYTNVNWGFNWISWLIAIQSLENFLTASFRLRLS